MEYIDNKTSKLTVVYTATVEIACLYRKCCLPLLEINTENLSTAMMIPGTLTPFIRNIVTTLCSSINFL